MPLDIKYQQIAEVKYTDSGGGSVSFLPNVGDSLIITAEAVGKEIVLAVPSNDVPALVAAIRELTNQ